MRQSYCKMPSNLLRSGTKVADGNVIKDDIAFAAGEITRNLRRTFDARMRPMGLSQTKWRLLIHLQHSDGLNQTELAQLLELERPSVGQAIDDLEKLDMVKRKASATDRRVWRVHLRPAARMILKRMRREADDIYETMWAGYSLSDLRTLRTSLQRVASQLASIDQEAVGVPKSSKR